jgi:hypothetical protein
VRRLLIIPLLTLVPAACGSSGTSTTPTTAKHATRPATTAQPTPTTVSERLAHWQDVVSTMNCSELADLEQKRLAIQFNDQTESLIAIHDRQAKLHCPQ